MCTNSTFAHFSISQKSFFVICNHCKPIGWAFFIPFKRCCPDHFEYSMYGCTERESSQKSEQTFHVLTFRPTHPINTSKSGKIHIMLRIISHGCKTCHTCCQLIICSILNSALVKHIPTHAD